MNIHFDNTNDIPLIALARFLGYWGYLLLSDGKGNADVVKREDWERQVIEENE